MTRHRTTNISNHCGNSKNNPPDRKGIFLGHFSVFLGKSICVRGDDDLLRAKSLVSFYLGRFELFFWQATAAFVVSYIVI